MPSAGWNFFLCSGTSLYTEMPLELTGEDTGFTRVNVYVFEYKISQTTGTVKCTHNSRKQLTTRWPTAGQALT